MQNFSEHLFWRKFANGCFWKCVDNKLFIKRINFTLKKPRFFQHQYQKWKCLLLFHDWFSVKFEFIHKQYFFGMMKNRSSHWRCSVGEGVLRNFVKFLGKHLSQSLFFNKVAGLRKKETLTRVFSCAKFSRTPFLQNTSGRLLLEK